MSTKNLIIIGCGGHAKVVLDALISLPHNYDIAFADDNPELIGSKTWNFPIKGPIASLEYSDCWVHLAVGDNKSRQKIFNALTPGFLLLTITHPGAIISAAASLAPGVFVAAHAIVAPSSRIDEGAIINHGAVVDHDVTIGAFAHIAPNVTLGGKVTIGERVLVGSGATILPGINIGNDVTVGAGAVVVRDIPANTLVKGIPAE